MCTQKNEQQTLTNIKTNQNHIDRLYACRDLEIKNLWQRSIFLATFLVLCFTAYGTLIKDVLCSGCTIKDFPCLNLVLIFISLVGVLMSILWICMAKGSKAWQEVYEDAIGKYEEEYLSEDIPENYRSNKLKGDPSKRDRCLLSVNGGPYSPSKINIVIGQLSFTIWILIYLVHVISQIKNSIESGQFNNCVPIIIASVIVLVIIWLMLRDPYKKNKANWFNVVSKHLLHPDNEKGNKEKAEKPESE